MTSHILHTNEPFHFEAGGILPSLSIEYRTSERDYKAGDKVIWICHALTANSDPEDWWPGLVGRGCLLDPEKYFIVCVNMIGSPYGSSSPRDIDPSTLRPYMLNFPRVSVRDMVRANILVRKALGISTIDLIVGGSIGGFQAVEWATMEPEVIRSAAFVATSPRVTPWVTAQMEAQRMALLADPSFLACESLQGGLDGLRCARAQALLTYRSYEGYCLTQAEEDPDTLFADRAASYERYQGQKLTRRAFDAYSYYYLTYAVDSHNVGRGRGGVAAALSRIKANVIVAGIDSDGMFPPSGGKEFAAMIPGAKYRVINSKYGHDGFLLETEQLQRIISSLGTL